MKKIVVYVRNKESRPSDYYRFLQYVEDIDAKIIIRSLVPNKLDRITLDSKSNGLLRIISLALAYIVILMNFTNGYFSDKKINPDRIVVIREIFPRKILKFYYLLLKKSVEKFDYIWDFDDSIIGTEISKAESDLYFNNAKKIVVSTPYLKALCPESYQDKIDVLSTTDGDLSKYSLNKLNTQREKSYKNTINIVWVATANNLPNLEDVVEYIDSAAKQIQTELNKQLRLKVVCNKPLDFKARNLIIENIQWTHDIALEAIIDSHIGIMPLMQNEFALGKAGFKLIQYMSGGLPVIASDVGYNSSVIEDDFGFLVNQNNEKEWIDAIYKLACDYKEWNEFSINALNKWNEKYSYAQHLNYWNKILFDE